MPLLDPNKNPFPEEVKQLPGFDPTGTLANFRSFDPVYWTDNSDAWQKEYLRVMARG
jgi:spermidine/putrescine transport system substrate-binding protein